MRPWRFERVAFLLSVIFFASAYAEDTSKEEKTKEVADDAIMHISDEEFSAIFALLDLDKDGKANLEDLEKFSQSMRTRIAKKDIRVMSIMLDKVDTNKDGKVSLEELMADMAHQQPDAKTGEKKESILRKAFRGLRGLTPFNSFSNPFDSAREKKKQEESDEEQKKLQHEKFKYADRNADNFLELAELPGLFYPETGESALETSAQNLMKGKDKNGDGKLSAEEFWQDGYTVAQAEKNEAVNLTEEETDGFKRLDANGDGFMDLTELKGWESGQYHHQEALKHLFNLADSDSDGIVTLPELQGARKQIALYLMGHSTHDEL